jgi:phosphoribosylformylglycinamidine cyclo-ligase
MGHLDNAIAADIIRGIGEGCRLAQCALIGGETAEMPGMYRENEYDLAGFVVGVVDNSKIPDGSEIRAGYKLIGIGSSGLHSNGFSLVRKICFEVLKLKVDSYVPELGKTLAEELLTPTRIYTETVQRLIKDLPILGLAHITGGGIVENVLRIIPQSFGVAIQRASWDVAPVFHFLQQAGNLSEAEMMRTFNNGIGMVLIVPETHAQDVLDRLSGMDESAFVIGETVERREGECRFLWADEVC